MPGLFTVNPVGVAGQKPVGYSLFFAPLRLRGEESLQSQSQFSESCRLQVTGYRPAKRDFASLKLQSQSHFFGSKLEARGLLLTTNYSHLPVFSDSDACGGSFAGE